MRSADGRAARRPAWVLAVLASSQLMIILDGTVVNIALPTAQQDLGFGTDQRQWIVVAYSLAYGGLLLLGGRLTDLLGRRAAFLAGLIGLQSPDEDTDAETVVHDALSAGYRLIDTAEVFGCEAAVGAAVRRSELAREDVFVQTKRLPDAGTPHDHDSTLRAFDASLERLGFDHVDAYLIHWPKPDSFDGTIQAWKALERLLAGGRTRTIGVSNFSVDLLDRLISVTDVVPALNQIELHPYFNQAELREAHRERGILTQAWSPLGGVCTWLPGERARPVPLMENPVITEIADRHGRSPAQIVLRWHLQHGNAVVPKSVRPARIKANSDVFDFTLAAPDAASIDGLDTGAPGGPRPDELQ